MILTPAPDVLQAAEGCALQALRYPAHGPRVGHLLVAGATGVPQRQYRRFAEIAAERGLEVWTLDYQRIGLSKPPGLRGFRIMWRVLGPLIVKAKGYLAWSLLGMGEDLPRDVFYQWRRWCQRQRYFFDDTAQAHWIDAFAQVRCPIRAVNASDDALAPPT